MIKIIAELLERLKGEENLEQKVWNKIHGEPEGGDFEFRSDDDLFDGQMMASEILKGLI